MSRPASARPASVRPAGARRATRPRKNLWFERLMAIVALANFGLVLFDLTYVPLRNFWLLGNLKLWTLTIPIPLPPPAICPPLTETPPDRATLITQCYDRIKGIEPHRDTERYLATIDELQADVQRQGLNALTSPEITADLQEVSRLSTEMIATNPFQAADKSGTLERIKNLMRDHMRSQLATLKPAVIQNPFLAETTSPSRAVPTRFKRAVSASDAFRVFWSPVHLNAANWSQEITWFNTHIRPLVQTNYYRSISENGEYTNNFWILDAPFVGLFLLEFLARTFYISRRYTGVSWFGAMVWRWYDLPLIFPFGLLFSSWAWLRIISVLVRLHQARLVNMERIRDQATQGFVSSIAEEITEVVIVQVIDQTQAAIRRGDLSRMLQQATKTRIDINNIDEVAELTKILVQMTVYHVFPKIQPDVEALLSHNIEGVLNQSPGYQAIVNLPGGLGTLPKQFTDRLVQEVVKAAHTTFKAALEDQVGSDLTNRLVHHLSEAVVAEIQKQNILPEVQALLNDLLEEIKLSYVGRSSDIDAETVMEERRQLKQIARQK